ncbi:MAG: trypsin-like peptidase domain-containing protein [Candidatus Paracaedibacteraceae bacterium]|nr:trypsin-like peptidase domain-containing protein [Candidatus Paracaedibacteraceae bacterium]
MVKRSLTTLVLSLLVGSALAVQHPTMPEPIPQNPDNGMGLTEDPSFDQGKGKKKILDLVRKGVVIIDVKTYANVEANERVSWAGSGFIVDKEKGIIATNKHVAGDMTVSTYTVKFADGTSVEAHHLPMATLGDYAFLKVDPAQLPKTAIALEFATAPITVNQTIYSMGNSARDEFSTFKGTVYSVYENLGPYGEQSFSFSGLTVGGASGSPIFDDNGKVVGIVYGGKFTSGSGLPASYLIDALQAIKEDKKPQIWSTGAIPGYGIISDYEKAGMLPKAAADQYKEKFPDSHNKVAIVQGTVKGTAASELLEVGDLIWSLNDELIGPNLYQFEKSINMASGKEVKIEVYRNGKLVEIKLTPYALSAAPYERFVSFGDVTWFSNNEFVKYLFGEKEPGVFIMGIGQTSPFKALTKGDQFSFFMGPRLFAIRELNDKPIKSLEDLEKVIPELAKKKTFTVKYIDYGGSMGLGNFSSMDRQERRIIITYAGKFDSPKLYIFNEKSLEWDSKDIE